MSRADQEQRPNAAFKHQLSQRFAECALLVSFGSAVFMLLSLLSYHRHDSGWSTLSNSQTVHNMAGQAGAWVADLLLATCGYVAFILPPMIVVWAWLYWQGVRNDVNYFKQNQWTTVLTRTLSFLLILLASAGLFSLYLPNSSHLPFSAGGLMGDVISFGLIHQLGLVGVSLALLTVLFSAITVYSGLSWLWVVDNLGRFIWQSGQKLFDRLTLVSHFFVGRCKELFSSLRQRMVSVLNLGSLKKTSALEQAANDATQVQISDEKLKLSQSKKRSGDAADHTVTSSGPSEKVACETSVSSHSHQQQPAAAPTVATLSQDSVKTKPRQQNKTESEAMMPTLALLDQARASNNAQLTHQYLESMSAAVESHLKDFGVVAQVVAAFPGPVVTRFELQLAAGTKASKVTGLAKDIARSLSVKSVRVAEIIPGKSVIGLELPNLNRETVVLSEILGSQEYLQSSSTVTLALGKDIAGHPIVVDLAKMPHLLVAGTTGSGKSVGLNAILMSLLFKSSPEELRLILIDPKMLELAIYEGIPHLLTPVVTDMKDAASVLRWCVAEMERRYRLMASVGVRNLAGFNAKIKQAKKDKQPILDPTWEADLEGQGVAPELTELPTIVVMADEFADMIMVVGKKVEELIARIAQKARAAGIHLILATQRPSVDVITGLIKANVPTRIAFQVSSKVDSRTILDQQGAEQLLGNGDMLYLAPGSGVPIRVHGAFVSDDEVQRVVDEIKMQRQADYLFTIDSMNLPNDPVLQSLGFSGGSESDDEQDALYDQAVAIVLETRRASVSGVQRRLKIGYNRAARLVEAMERAGLVSAMDGSGNREVLVPDHREN